MSKGEPQSTSKTKLAVTETVVRAYSLVFNHLGNFVALAAIPLFIVVAGKFFHAVYIGAALLEIADMPEVEQVHLDVFLLAFGIFILSNFIPWLIFIVAWHRFALFGKRDSRRPVEFHVGRREAEFLGYGLLLALYILIFTTVLSLLFSFLDVPTEIHGASIDYIPIYSSELGGDILLILLSVRFLFVFPATAVGEDTGTRKAWTQSRGVAWRLFWVLLLVALPFDFLYHLMDSSGTEETASAFVVGQGDIGAVVQRDITVGDLLVMIVQGFVLFLGSAVSVSALALSYRHAVGVSGSAKLDIYRTASDLIREHGDEADLVAAMRADEFLEKGDMDGSTVWRKVLKAIKKIQRHK